MQKDKSLSSVQTTTTDLANEAMRLKNDKNMKKQFIETLK